MSDHFRDAGRLARLLEARPELDSPPLRSLVDLEVRMNRTLGPGDAFARLSLVEWTVLQAAVLSGNTATLVDLAELIGTPIFADDVEMAANRLESLGLVVRIGATLAVDPALKSRIGFPGALGPSLTQLVPGLSVASLRVILERYCKTIHPSTKTTLVSQLIAVLEDPDELAVAYAALPKACGTPLDAVTFDNPVFIPEDPWWQPTADPRSATNHLQAWGLLLPYEHNRVAMAREVSLARRGGRVFVLPMAPAPLSTTVVDGGAAVDVVARFFGEFDRLLAVVAADPLVTLQSGGIGMTVLKRLSKVLGTDVARVADLLDLAAAVGLLTVHNPNSSRRRSKPEPFQFVVGDNYRSWVAVDIGQRWLDVLRAWFSSELCHGLGGRPDSDSKVQPAVKWLVEEFAMHVRRCMIGMASDGVSLSQPVAVAQWCQWNRPLVWRANFDVETFVKREGALLEMLGVTIDGVAHEIGREALRRLLDPTFQPLKSPDDVTVRAVATWLTQAASTMKVQGDMTIVVTGRPAATLTSELALMAEVVSQGAATVYRLTEKSLQRAFEAGRTAERIVALMAEHATVPASVATLIDDASRRFGRYRVAKATSVIVVSDAIAAAELSSSRNVKVKALHLVQIAPTTFLADEVNTKVLVVLKEAGFTASAYAGRGNDEAALATWAVTDFRYQFAKPRLARSATEAAEALLKPVVVEPAEVTFEDDDRFEMPVVGDAVFILHDAGGRQPTASQGVVEISNEQVILLRTPNGRQIVIPYFKVVAWQFDDDQFVDVDVDDDDFS